jgi:tyrosine-protein kinase Etk/Wzc
MDERNHQAGETSEYINIKEILVYYLSYWKWFLLSLLISGSLGYVYMRYQIPLYQASSKIKIKDIKSSETSVDEMTAFQDIELFKGGRNIENEIEMLRSRNLMMGVVRALKANIFYYSYGRPIYHERYKNSPIELNYVMKDTVRETHPQGVWTLTPMNESEFQLMRDKKKLGTFKFGENIEQEDGIVQFNRTRFFRDKYLKKPFKVSVTPIDMAANYFLDNLDIIKVNKTSDVLLVSIRTPDTQKSIDIISELISEYNEDVIEEKNLTNKKTAEFITDRLELLLRELDSVEVAVEEFKKANKLTNIDSEANLFLNTGSQSEIKSMEAVNQLRLVEYMLEEMSKNKTPGDLIPSNLGLQDITINNLIAEHNKIIIQSSNVLKYSGNRNPMVENIYLKLADLRSNIIQSLQTLKNTLEINISELNKREAILNNRIASVPRFEREYRNIRRQQQIKETLYLYLLQKREETNIALAGKSYSAKIIDEAHSSSSKIAPKAKTVLTLSVLLGLLIPGLIIYLKNLLNTRVSDKKDLTRFNVPYLGEVPLSDKNEKLIVTRSQKSIISEYFRLLRTNIEYIIANKAQGGKIIMVTSTIGKEGKSFISINLASSFSLLGSRVLLVGLDLRHPKLNDYLKLKIDTGITNYLVSQDDDITQFIDKADDELIKFDILNSGPIPPNPAELLKLPKVKKMFDDIRSKYDYIIVDTAPVGLVTDTLIISDYSDCTVFVVRANHLEKKMLSLADGYYRENKLKHMAFLLNGNDASKLGYYQYGYGYVEKTETPWWVKVSDMFVKKQ